MSRAIQRVIAAIDQGTSSTRCILFDHSTHVLATHQLPLSNFYPKPGWVEQEPAEILETATDCLEGVMVKARELGHQKNFRVEVVGLGITNQRETTIVWDKLTGKPLHRAIVWSDTRTKEICDRLAVEKNQDFFRDVSGLPISTYFSAVKLRWLLENSSQVAKAVEEDRALFGTVETWLIWNLTGGANSGKHITDVSNASRTMLMNLKTRKWDDQTCRVFGIPESLLPTIKSNSEVYGRVASGALKDVPISGCVGDQQAALLGQLCTEKGTIKNTYGTGCFALLNTGTDIVYSKSGLLTTVAFQLGQNAPVKYALEGSVAVAGSAVQWLRDNLKLITSSQEINEFAEKVKDTGGMYFVPAFSGLLSPYWRPDARGVVCGMTFYTTKEHLCRAILEATCYQTKEVLEAMIKDADLKITTLKVDGGMGASDVMLQFQADILNLDVARATLESTGLGAAFAAGLAVGFWDSLDELRTFESKKQVTVFSSSMDENRRATLYRGWKKAVSRSLDWVESEKPPPNDSTPRLDLRNYY